MIFPGQKSRHLFAQANDVFAFCIHSGRFATTNCSHQVALRERVKEVSIITLFLDPLTNRLAMSEV